MIDLTGPPRPWSTRLVARFADCQARSLRGPWWQSPGPRGEPALLDRLGELFGCPGDATVVTGGVRQFAAAWAATSRMFAVETPTFSDIPEIFSTAGPVRAFSWPELAAGALADASPGTVWATSPYRNPDGRSLTAAHLRAAERLIERGHAVVVNQVYRWFAPAGQRLHVPAGAWAVTSLAKLAGGGTRLGWAIAPRPDAVTRNLTCDAPPPAWQRAWAEFLDEPTVRMLWTDCVEPTLAARRGFVDRARELLGWEIPGGGPSLLVACAGIAEPAALDTLARAGVRVSPGGAFGTTKSAVRLSFSGASVADAKRAVDRLAAFHQNFSTAASATGPPNPRTWSGRSVKKGKER